MEALVGKYEDPGPSVPCVQFHQSGLSHVPPPPKSQVLRSVTHQCATEGGGIELVINQLIMAVASSSIILGDRLPPYWATAGTIRK